VGRQCFQISFCRWQVVNVATEVPGDGYRLTIHQWSGEAALEYQDCVVVWRVDVAQTDFHRQAGITVSI